MPSFAQPIADDICTAHCCNKGMPTCGSSCAQLAVRQHLYLVSIRITALSEPQAQELFVNALWLLVLCMPSFIRLLYPVPACSLTERKEKTTPFGVNLMRSQVLSRTAQGAAHYIIHGLWPWRWPIWVSRSSCKH